MSSANRTLSLARADAVRAYLRNVEGLNGVTRPIATTTRMKDGRKTGELRS